MKRLTISVLFLAASTMMNAAPQAADKAEVAYKAALEKEVADGDLKSAIAQYEKLARGANRAVAAKALVRIGQCYEKLGSTEARKAYERAVREFAEQKESAAQARARLAALAGPRPGAGEMILRALDSGPQFGDPPGGMSSDGSLIAFPDYYRGGSPSVYETATKKIRRLVNLEWDQPKTGFGAQVAISRDGKRVAFLWYSTGPGAELRLVGTDGTGMRILASGQSAGTPLDWSPDGRSILTHRGAGDASKDETGIELTFVSVDDGSVRSVKKLPRAPSYARMSPDSRWIAYQASDSVAKVIASDGTADKQLFADDPKAQLVDWTPDGKGLVFLSDRSGARALWHVAMEDGKGGDARLLRGGMASEIFPVGIGGDGRMLFVENTGLNNSYVVPMAGGAPARLTRRFEGNNGFAAYSTDGKRLAWFGLKEQFSVKGSTLVVQGRASGREKTLAAPDGAVMNYAPQWLDDNRSLVFQVTQSNKDMLVKLDVETGQTSKIVDAQPHMWSLLSPDGKTNYFAKRKEGHIVALDIATGVEKKIAQVTPNRLVRALALSPDGKTLAFVVQHPQHLPDPSGFVGASIELCDLVTGKVTILKRPDNKTPYVGFYRRTLQFTPDGKALVVTTGPSKPVRIRLLPLDGGPDKILVPSTGLLFDASVSPDGKYLSYTESTTKSDLWMLENFLPKVSAR